MYPTNNIDYRTVALICKFYGKFCGCLAAILRLLLQIDLHSDYRNR